MKTIQNGINSNGQPVFVVIDDVHTKKSIDKSAFADHTWGKQNNKVAYARYNVHFQGFVLYDSATGRSLSVAYDSVQDLVDEENFVPD